MNSNYDIVKIILDNKSDYTELRINHEHIMHFYKNQSKYIELYGCSKEINFNRSEFPSLIINAMTKNEYINGIYVDLESYGIDASILLSAKTFKSICIYGCSREVINYLNTHENKVEKLKLSSLNLSYDVFEKIPETCKLLNSLDIRCTIFTKKSLNRIFETIHKTNITDLTLSFSCYSNDLFEEFGMFISKNKTLKSLHVKNDFSNFIDDNIYSNNYTLLNITINNEYIEKITNITNRNKKYMMTILLCMNKKIIPRCVFKTMILAHII